ncbi:GspH/FimT family pseudopilin [Desulfosoma caldarium]|uniref:Type II secretion system protein H n=1 Tax=Desulfosoma caldarium TaxID=610254 RepID=A0A3N1VIS3_9BACT|nr:GspH/FimT family pseudopilin [Desulfosoma caldarium]ROR01939.1 prepilin-type N-terminal cleavage/methylation domain-containing protein [Desulfosoma caldarium]
MKGFGDRSGFTLVELMVTVAIVALLLKFVGWGLAGVTSYEDVRTSARRLETVIQEAKALAYEKGAVHSVIFSPDGRGYRLFRDDDGDDNQTEPSDGNCLEEPNEPRLRTVELSSRVSLSLGSSLPKNSNNDTCLAFRSDGRLANGEGGEVTFIGTSGAQARVSINAMGWVHVEHVE